MSTTLQLVQIALLVITIGASVAAIRISRKTAALFRDDLLRQGIDRRFIWFWQQKRYLRLGYSITRETTPGISGWLDRAHDALRPIAVRSTAP